MRIVFIGDIMGRSGREALEQHLPEVRERLAPDAVIVNGENAANGAGITEKICKGFYGLGVDCITTGNHVWDQREILVYITRDKKLLRPVNYPDGTPGQGVYRHSLPDGRVIVIINAMARLFMDALEDPFRVVAGLVKAERLGGSAQAIFVDFHGEATSEKMALAHYLDGKISALVGTHTHVPTADAHIMEHGSGYMSDAGMSGDYDSVIGVRKDIGVHRFVKKTPGERMTPARGKATLCGVFIETDDITGLCRRMAPFRLGGLLAPHMPER